MSISTLFEQELRALIAEEINRIAENLCTGHHINELHEYKYETGRVAALRRVLDMCEEAADIVNRR